MKKYNDMLDKAIAKIAYKSAQSNVNSNCAWFFYQQKPPEKLKKLRKF